MTYAIDIPASVYMNWQCVDEFLSVNTTHVIFSPSARDWFNDKHPEILKVSDIHRYDDGEYGRTFTFESEAHYTWFLLQQ